MDKDAPPPCTISDGTCTLLNVWLLWWLELLSFTAPIPYTIMNDCPAFIVEVGIADDNSAPAPISWLLLTSEIMLFFTIVELLLGELLSPVKLLDPPNIWVLFGMPN